ncbi:MAG: ABC transporter ATP-binding protein [Alphaproteobacteria bacterium]
MSRLVLSNVSKRFGTVPVLKDINLSIEPGSFVCLLGPSGCGKTTLLRTIAGFEGMDAGDVSLEGQSLTAVPSFQRNIGMVFQSLALFPHLNVIDNIAYGLTIRGEARPERYAKAQKLIDLVDLDGLQKRRVSALSGGQKQRVAIARALAIEPALFLMDEPFSALDAGLRERLQKEVKQLQRRLGVTTIFVTHDQQEAMTLADQIVVMDKGVVEQAGSPGDVYHRPQTRFVAEFVGQNNILDIKVEQGMAYWLGHPIGTAPAHCPETTTLAVRPEHLHLCAGSHSVSGEVAFVRQLGSVIETQITAGPSTLIQTQLASAKGAPVVGERVDVSFDLDQAWVLPS